MRSALVLALLVVAALATALALNLVLLSRASAQNDRVGRLVPTNVVPPAPVWTVRPVTGRIEDLRADD